MVSTSVTQNIFPHEITGYIFMGETVMSRTGGTFKLLPPPSSPLLKRGHQGQSRHAHLRSPD